MMNERYWTVVVVLLYVCCSVYSTHDESPMLPMATLMPDDSVIVEYNVTGTGADSTLSINCSGRGDLTWFRGSPPKPIPTNLTNLINDTLILTISPVVDGIDASSEGIPYYCTANNSLGVARSHTVTVIYAFFSGFSSSNNTVPAVLTEAVALSCNVLSAQPPPYIVWYNNDDLIVSDETKYNIIDDGDTLVIYDLEAADISDTYHCGVTNVRRFETVNSSTVYNLMETTVESDSFISYRPPRNQTKSADDDDDVTFYYIAATSGSNTRAETSVDDFTFDADTLSVSGPITGTTELDFFLRESGPDAAIGDSTVFATVTVTDPLTITQRPSNNTMMVYHTFADDSISFVCASTGTGVMLTWYKDGVEIEGQTSATLTFDVIALNDSGVYQCFWDGIDSVDMDTWGLTVQQPIQPRNFTFLSNSTTYLSLNTSFNDTIVPAGTSVQLTLTFIADTLPSITWMFTNTSNSVSIDNDGRYNITDTVEVEENTFQVKITFIVTSSTSGYYEALVNDSRTDITSSGSYFVSEEVSVSIVSFEIITEYGCLLDNRVTTLECEVVGLPRPMITFLKDNDLISGVQGPFFTFDNPDDNDEGLYRCRADNTLTLDNSDNQNLRYCESPMAVARNATVNAAEGDQATLYCNISGVPSDNIDVSWFKDDTQLSRGNRIDIRDTDDTSELIISDIIESDAGMYSCQVTNSLIPQSDTAYINLTVSAGATELPSPLPVYVPIVAAVGGLIVLIVVVAIVAIIVCVCCFGVAKKGSYSTRKASDSKDFTDGRGNVDADSDEEDQRDHQPEEFQPQYESLPVLRPAQPPEYKPSPAYNNFGPMDDMEMVKIPPPDTESTVFEYNPQGQGYIPNSGPNPMMMGSNMGLQARFDDFMTEDSQFV